MNFPNPESESSTTAFPRWLWVALVIWIALVAAGWYALTAYANEGTVPAAPEPTAAASPAPAARLMMSLHPHCPCSAASLRELHRIMDRATRETECVIYFYRPANESDAWVQGAHWRTAQRIPQTQVIVDPEGRLAAGQGMTTSGEVRVLDARGVCQFRGGLTASRGHEGDSVGQSAVASILRGESAPTVSAPVFGCAIQ